jgi:hypothetical protein
MNSSKKLIQKVLISITLGLFLMTSFAVYPQPAFSVNNISKLKISKLKIPKLKIPKLNISKAKPNKIASDAKLLHKKMIRGGKVQNQKSHLDDLAEKAELAKTAFEIIQPVYERKQEKEKKAEVHSRILKKLMDKNNY